MLANFDWNVLNDFSSISDKMYFFQTTILGMFRECFPLKRKRIFTQNEPFMNDVILKLRRKKRREFHKHRMSEKYIQLDQRYRELLSKSMKSFYKRRVKSLRTSNPRAWYRNIKQLIGYDAKEENPTVENIKHLSATEQAEHIAESFAKISQEYEPLNRSGIALGKMDSSDYLKIAPSEVMDVLSSMDANKAVPKNDIPTKILKRFSSHLSEPLAGLITECICKGVWPDFLKIEAVTPVPKVKNMASAKDLRKICGLPNLSKVMEKVIVKYIVKDMKNKLDVCQFANQPNMSINHYLIQMVDRVLSVLDGSSKGEHTAVIATLVDWSSAFDRQDLTLAIKSFQENGVRDSLIPILMSFFEGRRMFVKWHGSISGTKDLPGEGAQGTSLGLWSFLSQTNDNPENTEKENIFKFVDDKTFLEVVNLLSIGIASHNYKARVPSNVKTSGLIISHENLKSQEHLNSIQKWTKKKQMLLNIKKTKNMIFNFSKNSQFSTEIELNGDVIETVSETKLLGTIITDKLDWRKNTENIVKEANKRMAFLHKSSKFATNRQDLKKIYILQIRSKLEQSAALWHSSLTQICRNKLERVQKSALRIIMGSKYTNYNHALEKLNLQTLDERRQTLCLKFAKKCLETEKLKKMFPLSRKMHHMKIRGNEKYLVKKSFTERHKKSALPYMQRMLNDRERQKQKIMKQI